GEPDGKKRVTLSGMAFKGQPETSDLRGSSSVYIARKLKDAGYLLNLHDFVAKRDEMEALKLGDVYDDIYDACENSRLLLILNNHKKYIDLQEHEAILKSRNGFAVFDSWGVCQNLLCNDNIDLYNLGNIMIK
ncbi:MAG: hypothetical protein IK096_01790, partial [Lachnospiraceae bacterium]|nr:hypothetical protein [Lachnospiraceae bacterium]